MSSKPDPAKSLKRELQLALEVLQRIEGTPYSIDLEHIWPDYVPASLDPFADSAASGPVPLSTGPFTPEKVVALLRGGVLNENALLPRPTDPTIAYLANALNAIWSSAQSAPAWRENQERLRKIEDAIRVLTEILPEHRAVFTSTPFGLSEADARDDLAAFDALVTAARAARERGLPRAKTVFIETVPTEEWRHFAEYLMAIFQFSVPKQPKAAAYRFIAAVTPDISGEHTTSSAVETAFKKKSFVNRGNRAD